MRCSNTRKCGHRFTLRKHPDKYVRNKYKCPKCGRSAYSDEQNRLNELEKQNTCRCPGLPFRHRKASHRLCHHHPSIDETMTEEEYLEYEPMLHQLRGGNG